MYLYIIKIIHLISTTRKYSVTVFKMNELLYFERGMLPKCKFIHAVVVTLFEECFYWLAI